MSVIQFYSQRSEERVVLPHASALQVWKIINKKRKFLNRKWTEVSIFVILYSVISAGYLSAYQYLEIENRALFVQLIKSQRQTAPHCSRYRYSYLYMNAARDRVYTVHLERLRQTVEQKVFAVSFHFSHIFFFANWSEGNTFKTELNGASLTKMFKARLKTHPGESEVCVWR